MDIPKLLVVLAMILLAAQPTLAASSDLNLIDVIDDVLFELEPIIHYNQTAKELLLLTVAVESDCGANTESLNGSIGWFQILPSTLKETEKWAKTHMLEWKLKKLREKSEIHYHAAIARIYYFKCKMDLPKVKWVKNGRGKMDELSISEIAKFWKKFYNTCEGSGTVKTAIYKYKLYWWGRNYG